MRNLALTIKMINVRGANTDNSLNTDESHGVRVTILDLLFKSTPCIFKVDIKKFLRQLILDKTLTKYDM